MGRNEQVLDDNRTRAGAAHAHGLPVVDDLVLIVGQQALDPVDRLVAIHDDAGELTPGAVGYHRAEVPPAGEDKTAIGCARAALLVGDAGGDHGVRIVFPHLALGAFGKDGERAMVGGEVGDVPGDRGVAAAEHFRNIGPGDQVELHAAPGFRLKDAQEAGAVKLALDLGRQAARLFNRRRLLAQERHKGLGATHRFSMIDAGKALCRQLVHDYSLDGYHRLKPAPPSVPAGARFRASLSMRTAANPRGCG